MNGSTDYFWLKLFSIEGFGAVRINRMYLRAKENGITIEEMFDLEEELFNKIFAPNGEDYYNRIHRNDDDTAQQYQRLYDNNITIIHPEHNLYPRRFRTLFLENAPILLFAWGNLSLLESTGTAIVGSRDASDQALNLSEQTAAAAAQAGFTVVSGYARGVDSSAHFGALKAGGVTTMVLSYGIEHFSVKSLIAGFDLPRESLALSQFHPRDTWKNNYGMIRNRVVVGLSQAVIVITAEEKSGTINTAQIALKAGIPLFVMSPELFSVKPAGNIELIKNGGIEITDTGHIIQELNKIANSPKPVVNDLSTNQGKLPL